MKKVNTEPKAQNIQFEKEFIIQTGSLCFNLPLLFNNNNCFQDYFDQVKYIREQEKKKIDDCTAPDQKRRLKSELKDRCINLKEEIIIKQLKSEKIFDRIRNNYNNPQCPAYNSRFLCKCFSLAIRFHDDDNQSKEMVQFHVDTYNLSSPLLPDKIFTMDITLHVLRENDEIQAHLVLNIPIVDLSADELITLKHLFYKKKFKVFIESTGLTSLDVWRENYIKNIYKAVEKQSDGDILPTHFGYSLLEITSSAPEIDVKDQFNNQVYSKLLYGMITSDEGWRFFPEESSIERLKYYWTSRDFFCSYFLGTNGLILNYRESDRAKDYKTRQRAIFSKYKHDESADNKYLDFINSHPCVAGVDSLVFFNFQKLITKKETLHKGNQLLTETEKRQNKSEKIQIEELRYNLKNIGKYLDSVAFHLDELDNLSQAMFKAFNISSSLDLLKESYEQKANELQFEYDSRTNNRLNILSILTLFIGLSQILLILYCASAENFLESNMLINTISHNRGWVIFIVFVLILCVPLVEKLISRRSIKRK